MQKSPSYLVRQGNIYYFRIVVPVALRHNIGQREIKISLNTSYIAQARKKASFMALFIQDLFTRCNEERIMGDKDNKIPKTFVIEALKFLKKYCTEREEQTVSVEDVMTYSPPRRDPWNYDGYHNDRAKLDQEATEICESLVHIKEQLCVRDYSQVSKLVRIISNKAGVQWPSDEKEQELRFRCFLELQALCVEILLNRVNDTDNYPLYPWERNISEEVEKKPVLLKDVINNYISEKVSLKSWRGKTIKENMYKLSLFCDILDNPEIDDLDIGKIRFYKEKMMTFPKNHSKASAYKDKTVHEIIEMDIPEGDRVSNQTVSNTFNKVRSFLDWGKNQQYDKMRDLSSILKIRLPGRQSEARAPFDTGDLEKIFYSSYYLDRTFKKPVYFWLPLIALFTGARIEEICQLHLDDIVKEGGIWCININEKEEKELKTKASKRIVPLNPALVEILKFIEYKQVLLDKGETRLFPELSKQKDRGYSHEPSKWFGRYKKKIGIVDEEGSGSKTFHSFRHTFLNLCKVQGIDHDKAAQLVGHDTSDDMTYSWYAEPYPVDILYKDVISVLNYHLDFSRLKMPESFMK